MEIRQKKSNVKVLRSEFDNLRSSLQQYIKLIDYAHICSNFLKSSDLKLKSNSVVQQKKLCNLFKDKHSTEVPEKSSLIFLSMSYRIAKSHALLRV